MVNENCVAPDANGCITAAMRQPRMGSPASSLSVTVLSVSVAATACLLAGVALAETVRGTADDDRLVGARGADRIIGKGGDDVLRGRRSHDLLRGGTGRDRLLGGAGRDVLVGGRGPDQFNMRDGIQLGSPGRDVIRAQDGREDQIDCGDGRDVAYVDRAGEQGIFDCERVVVGGGRNGSRR